MLSLITKHSRVAVRQRLGLMVAIGAFGATLLCSLPAQATDQPAAAATDPNAVTVRPELGKIITTTQEQLRAGKFADALETLKGADTLKDLTLPEQMVLERLQAVCYLGAGKLEQADALQTKVIAHPELKPDDRLAVEKMMAQSWYNKAPTDRAVGWAKRYLADGGKDDLVVTILSQSLFKAGDCAGTLEALRVPLADAATAGRKPSEGRLQMLANCHQKLKHEMEFAAAMERLAVAYPKKEYWNSLLGIAERKPEFQDYLMLDAFRLRMHYAGMLDPEDYTEMAQLSLKAGYPAEARATLDAGVAAGLLGADKGGADYAKLRPVADSQSQDDLKALGQGDARLEAQKDGNGLFTAGLNYVSHGKFDTGLGMMERGLAKGGLKRPDQAHLQLAEAYVLAGRQTDALKALAEAQGKDGTADLAHLWTLVLQSAKP